MQDAIEVTARLGDTILDVRYVTDGRYAIAGQHFEIAQIEQPTVFRIGLVELSLRRVDPPRRTLPGPTAERKLSYVAGSFAVHLVLWAVAFDRPPDPSATLELDHYDLVTLHSHPESQTWEDGDSPDYATTGAGAPMRGEAGKAGGESPNPNGHIQIAKRAETPKLSREQAIEQARNAGIIGSTALSADGFKAIVGTADLSSAFDNIDVRAPLYGGTGEANGTFGLARNGMLLSAGCTDDCSGIIGVGRIGTASNGTSHGEGWGGHDPGAASIERRRHVATVPIVMFCGGPEPCVVDGGLDKAIVRRYIKREMPKIQYCYEKQLLADPSAAGTVDTQFLIATDGAVQDVTATGPIDAIASCVAGVIKNIQFPRARTGSTQVHYPLIFRWAGS